MASTSRLKDLTKEEGDSRYRHPTVYDAVAGRITAKGFIGKQPLIASNRDQPSSSTSATAPEAVLFRSRYAPTRYAECDIYFAHERNRTRDLPESDLLKALHCYASDFYSRNISDDAMGDWRSMDETALLALGILMEEASREVLGDTGDLAFTEGEEVVETPPKPSEVLEKQPRSRHSKRRRIDTGD